MAPNIFIQLLDKVLSRQSPDGYFVYPLECDVTITAETILLMHAIAQIDQEWEKRLVRYLQKQIVADGWVLYPEGPYDLSASIKAYFALKIAGESQDALYMQRIAEKIRQHGGLKMANVFTRCILAQFGELSFDETPWMPVELLLQPCWSPFHIGKFACWARAVIVPLSIVMTRKFRAKNPKNVRIDELYVPLTGLIPSGKKGFYYRLDRFGRRLERWIPEKLRKYAEKKALNWILHHDNREDGLGGIYTAMEYQVKALIALGFPINDPYIQKALEAISRLEMRCDGYSYMQPCVSPVWDTSIAMHALFHAKADPSVLEQGFSWLEQKQLIGIVGDWSQDRPDLSGGGWAFQFNNPFYPDLDDTAMCAWAMALVDRVRYEKSIVAAKNWIVGMQSKNGGFAAFNADQTNNYLNLIPFADHGALLDPPTEDVTGRVLSFLGVLNDPSLEKVIGRAVNFLRATQLPNGAWWGRWGTNYLYGTFSVLVGLKSVLISSQDPMITRALEFLYLQQNTDGGWGESCDTYEDPKNCGKASSLFHTSIVLIALLFWEKSTHPAIEKGVQYLLKRGSNACDPLFNAPGFPRVFYLKYHGYQELFPLWALSLYYEAMSPSEEI